MKLKALFASLGKDDAGVAHSALLLGQLAVLFYLAVLPFSHNAALKNLGLAAMLLALIWLQRVGRLVVDWRSPLLRALAGMLLVLALTAAFGVAPVDSFGELRKHFLPGVLLFLLIPCLFGQPALIRLLLSVLALAFMLRSGLTLVELGYFFPDLGAARAGGNFVKGYSLDAGFYLPVLMALLLLGGRWRWLAACGLMAAFLAMLLVQSRTPLVAIVVAFVCMLVVLRQWRPLLACVIAALLLGGFMLARQPEVADRLASTFDEKVYENALETKNYKRTEGLSARVPIWFGVLEITASRPWQGYGFGWKKLGGLAVEGGYVARWKAREGDLFAAEQADYFSQNPSTVNPHNLYLQVYFESGLSGLVAYLIMLAILFWQALVLAWRGCGINRIVAALALAYLVDHVILGLSNGLLIGLGPTLALIALLEIARRSEKTA